MGRAYTTVPLQSPDSGREARSIERALRRIPGVTRARVNPVTEMAYVEYDPAQWDERRLRHAVADATGGRLGPPCIGPTRGDGRDAGRRATRHPALTRAWEKLVVGVDAAGVAALPVGIVEAFVGGWVAGWVGLWAARLLGAARRAGPLPHGARCHAHLHYWLGALEQYASRPRRFQ